MKLKTVLWVRSFPLRFLKLNSFGPADIIARSVVKTSAAPLQVAEGHGEQDVGTRECRGAVD